MEFLRPSGAWALLALIPVILLWILKKRAKREDVPSLLLWKRMESEAPQSKPFQKLRSRLLLWLQILMVALLTFALMRPATTGGTQGDAVLIFDLSASMQAVDSQGVSRLERAKKKALQTLDGLRDADAVTILAAGAAFEQPVSRTNDHALARRAIENLQPENGGSDMEGALALARAMRRDIEGLRVYVFTDDASLSLSDGAIAAVGEPGENRALLDATMQPESGSAFARVKNYGEACDATLECYSDGALCDVRIVSLAAGEETGVRFSLPENAETVTVRLADDDALAADNVRYAVREVAAQRRALLVTSGNIFLERALGLDARMTVDLAAPGDAQTAAAYDLYVYDGVLPETLPESGAILAVNPTGEVLGVSAGEAGQVSSALRAASGAEAREICKNLLLTDVAIRAAKPLTGGTSVLEAGGASLLSVCEDASHRAAVLGFDVHDSNLPLKADFPVLIQNLLAWLLPEPTAEIEGAACGGSVAVTADVRSVNAAVVTPGGRTVPLAGGVFDDTQEIGVYTLRETFASGESRETRFALHVPAAESDTLNVAQASENAQKGAAGRGYREWTLWALLALFALALVEWEVGRRGA